MALVDHKVTPHAGPPRDTCHPSQVGPHTTTATKQRRRLLPPESADASFYRRRLLLRSLRCLQANYACT